MIAINNNLYKLSDAINCSGNQKSRLTCSLVPVLNLTAQRFPKSAYMKVSGFSNYKHRPHERPLVGILR